MFVSGKECAPLMPSDGRRKQEERVVHTLVQLLGLASVLLVDGLDLVLNHVLDLLLLAPQPHRRLLREPLQVHLLPRPLELDASLLVQQLEVSCRISHELERATEDVGFSSRVLIVLFLAEVHLKVEILPHVVLFLDMLLKPSCPFPMLVEDEAVDAADEAFPGHISINLVLPCAQLGKRVDDDAEDDVHKNRRDDDEEEEGVQHAIQDAVLVRAVRLDLPWNVVHRFAKVTLPQPHVQHYESALPHRSATRPVVVGLQLPAPDDVRLGELKELGEEVKPGHAEEVDEDQRQPGSLQESVCTECH
mmetsp:Transcript_18996/g.43594  ORF Transcript_18996/g.43594 Transcript_18996/m.43594 type:complete len:305 (+) Transcript_18996:451-1365(+)